MHVDRYIVIGEGIVCTVGGFFYFVIDIFLLVDGLCIEI